MLNRNCLVVFPELARVASIPARIDFAAAKEQAGDRPPLYCYAVSESAAATIVDIAATLGASRLILGAPRRHGLVNILRGNVVREVSDLLPEEIDLIVYA